MKHVPLVIDTMLQSRNHKSRRSLIDVYILQFFQQVKISYYNNQCPINNLLHCTIVLAIAIISSKNKLHDIGITTIFYFALDQVSIQKLERHKTEVQLFKYKSLQQ